MTATMYELTTMRDALLALVAEQEGEITPDQEAAWDAVQEDFEFKVERTVLFLRDLKGDAAKVKLEKERLAAMEKVIENNVARVERLLLDRMQAFGKEKVKTPLATAWLATTTAVQEVVPCDQADMRNVAQIAPAFVRHVPEQYVWEKNAIKDAAKAGTLPDDVAKRVAVVEHVGLRTR
jgi:hypothetical protein